jgi:hypothetical protein
MLGFYEAGALTTADRNMFQKTAARLEKTSLQTQYTGVGVVGTGMGGVSGKAGMAGIEGMGITGVLGISGVSRVSRGSMDSRHTRHRDIRDRRDQTEAKRSGGGLNESLNVKPSVGSRLWALNKAYLFCSGMYLKFT